MAKPKLMAAPPILAPATISEADGVRYLHLDTPWVQGAMRVRKPRSIELAYVQRMMAWMLLRPEAALAVGRAVQLGLGAGAITRFTHQVMHMPTTAVEINPSVIGACRCWFHLPADDEHLRVVQADAGAWVADAAQAGSAAVLCVDLYDHDAAAPVLDDAGFYADCARVLEDGGVMSVNLFGRDASFERSAMRIAAAFGHADDAPRVWTLQPTREGNTIVLAARGSTLPGREELVTRAESIEQRYGLPARKWLRMIRPLPPTRGSATAAEDTP